MKNKWKLRYYLNDLKVENTQILMEIHINTQRVRYSAHLTINPKFWDKKKQRCKSSYTNAFSKNLLLNRYSKDLQDYIDINDANRKFINAAQVREFLDNYFNPEKYLQADVDLIAGLQDFINVKMNKLNHNTIKSYKAILNHLEAYKTIKGLTKIDYSAFNEDFIQGFKNYLNFDKKLNENTVAKLFGKIISFFRYCLEKGIYIHPLAMKNLRIKEPKSITKSNHIALTDDEVNSIVNLQNLTDRESFSRDLFIIQVNTGFRFSDLVNLKESNFKKDRRKIEIVDKKTQQSLFLPLTDQMLAIAEKLEFNFRISNVEYNRMLKVLAEKAGIDEVIQLTFKYGNELINVEKKKYELVSTHTQRRTFITKLRKIMPREKVMKLVGHGSETVNDVYDKTKQEDICDELLEILNSK